MELTAKGFRLQEFLAFVFLIGTATALEGKLTIKKCCPKGQELNSALMCVNVTRDLENNKVDNRESAGKEPSYFSNNPSKIFFPDFNNTSAGNDSVIGELHPWFPFTSLISSTTLEEIPDLESIKDLFEKANFEYGARPECSSLEKEFSCFRLKYLERFHLVLYPGPDVKLYIFEKSSYHEEGHFKVENRDCGFSKIDPGENNTRARESGDLLGNSLVNLYELRTFPSEDFCLDNGPDGSFLAEYCPCNVVPCIRKCCGESEVYDGANDKCVRNLTFGDWRPPLENSSLTKNYYILPNRRPIKCANPSWLKLPQTEVLNSREKCGSQQEERNKFHFSSEGSLQVKNYNVPVDAYCGDHMIYDSVLLENNFLICQPDDDDNDDDDDAVLTFKFYGIFFIFSGVILVVTVAISLLFPELSTSTFNKAIICHNLFLLTADIFRGSSILLSHPTGSVCAFLSLVKQYSLLASLFWMSVLCWHILMGLREGMEGKRKFRNYATYACTTPAIITCVTAAMEFAPSLPPHYIRPGFDCYCGFNSDALSILVYLYGPVATLILINLLLYFWAFMRMLKIQKWTGSKANEKRLRKKRFVIFSKLFFSVEISWLVEIVGWLLRGEDYFWYFPDFLSILRAAFIFVILIWGKNVLRSLARRLNGCSDSVDDTKQNSATESDLAEVKRREKILMKQITQTFRRSDESGS